jgi:hypothetical protein
VVSDTAGKKFALADKRQKVISGLRRRRVGRERAPTRRQAAILCRR